MLYQSHDDDEVVLPTGLLPQSMNGILSINTLESIRMIADDIESVVMKDLYVILTIAMKHKADTLVTMIMTEITKRGKKSNWIFHNGALKRSVAHESKALLESAISKSKATK